MFPAPERDQRYSRPQAHPPDIALKLMINPFSLKVSSHQRVQSRVVEGTVFPAQRKTINWHFMTAIHSLQRSCPSNLLKLQQLSHVSYLCYWDTFIGTPSFLNLYDVHVIFTLNKIHIIQTPYGTVLPFVWWRKNLRLREGEWFTLVTGSKEIQVDFTTCIW